MIHVQSHFSKISMLVSSGTIWLFDFLLTYLLLSTGSHCVCLRSLFWTLIECRSHQLSVSTANWSPACHWPISWDWYHVTAEHEILVDLALERIAFSPETEWSLDVSWMASYPWRASDREQYQESTHQLCGDQLIHQDELLVPCRWENQHAHTWLLLDPEWIVQWNRSRWS